MKKREFKKNLRSCSHRRILLVAFLAAVWTGCAPPRSHLLETPRVAGDWLRALPVGRAVMQTLRAKARVEVRQGHRRFRIHTSLIAQFPDKMFVEADGLGIPACVALIEGDGMTIYMPSKQVAYRGDAREGMRYLLGVSLSGNEWRKLVLGYLPDYPSEVRNFQTRKKEIVLWLGSERSPTILTVDAQTGWLRSFVREDREKREIYFGSPLSTMAGDYPSKLKIVTDQGLVELDFENVVANPKISPDLFRMDLPPHVKVHALEYDQIVGSE